MTAIDKVIQIAKAEIGYLEKETKTSLDSKTSNAGDENYTKYARDMDSLGAYHANKQGLSWCAIFVDWVLTQAFGIELAYKMIGKPMGKYGAGCTEAANYYKKIDRFYKTPKVGDQIFFTRDGGKTSYHTGLVIGVNATTVTTIEGNTSSAAGVVENGGAVAQKSYRLSYNRIYGYGRPDYNLAGEDEDMTQEKFNEMMEVYLASRNTNNCAAWSKEAREFMTSSGLIAGNGTQINGEQNYCWPKFMTREEFATVLYRVLKFIGKA